MAKFTDSRRDNDLIAVGDAYCPKYSNPKFYVIADIVSTTRLR